MWFIHETAHEISPVAATGAPSRGHHRVLTGGHHFVDQSPTVIDQSMTGTTLGPEQKRA